MRSLELARSRCKSGAAFSLVAFAVLLVLQNELVISVSRGISTRLCSLYADVESRNPSLAGVNGDALEGWRWEFLQWGR